MLLDAERGFSAPDERTDMLPKQYTKLEAAALPKITKFCNGKDTTPMGAYPRGVSLSFRVDVPRALGAAAVVLRIAKDGCEQRDLPLTFLTADGDVDRYRVDLHTEELCDESGELFFYEFLFLRGLQTLFTDSVDNLHFELTEQPANRFRLLIHRADFHTPEWFRSGTMYHVFLDRFHKGNGHTELREGATLDTDWENGIPQFAAKPGDPLSNDVFFGGNLWGVIEKLDFLQQMGITVLYLSPIFEAASNHRYDTANYERVDPLLGGDEAFDKLIEEAHERGIKVILDGVFNHTGADSIYFNRYGNYGTDGAYHFPKSPYYKWYSFRKYPNDYEAWWGIEILPRLNHENKDCRRYFTGCDGIAAKWLKRGADGWRLDVADELSDDFLDELRTVVKEASNGEAVILGEVWENAVDKMAYGRRRQYFRGGQLDSVMNYPFRNAVLGLLQRGDTEFFVRILTELYATYPREVSDSLMNLLGTHDTERILTLLVDETAGEGLTNARLSVKRLSPEERERAVRLLKIASALQFTVYGVPSVYYGDEAGMEGYHDPFCRFPYPWGREDAELLEHYRMLGALRREHEALHGGDFRFVSHGTGYFMFERQKGEDCVLTAVNLDVKPHVFHIAGNWVDLMSDTPVRRELLLESGRCAVLVKNKKLPK